MRQQPLPPTEYENRIGRLQAEMSRVGLEAFVGYSSESESGCARFLTGFCPFFDFCCVVVPASGRATLVTGGPESYEFASRFVSAADIRTNPLLVESSAPDWVPESKGEGFSSLLPSVCGKTPYRVGVGGWNIFPHILFDDLRKGAPKADFVPADDVLLRVQSIKTDAEIPYIVEAYRITEEAMKAAFKAVKPGKREWEIEAEARAAMAKLGAEGTSYPPWVCSGRNTALSLCRSTDRAIQRDDFVQFSFGARYFGYCGNICRPLAIGRAPASARKLVEVGLEAVHYTLSSIRPGKRAGDVFQGYYDILARYGYESFTLYGPAHGTGYSEVEGLWLSREADFSIQPNMLFNIDIWLSDGQYGMRWEDGVLVTRDSLRELTSWRREIIEL